MTGLKNSNDSQDSGSDLDQQNVDKHPSYPNLRLSQILWPFGLINDFGLEENRRVVLASFLGLYPLTVVSLISVFPVMVDVGGWLMAFYFAMLWALFFRFLLPQAQAPVGVGLAFFFGVGFFSMLVLRLVYGMFGLFHFLEWMDDPSRFKNFMGNWLGAGFPEELIKSLPVFLYAYRRPGTSISSIVFLGLLSGLGFGIYEGVDYQKGRNFRLADSPHEYYLLNVLRLTALPFLHSIWSGIAAFFIGLYFHAKNLRWITCLGAFILPGILHGLFNYFGTSFANLSMALLSVIIFNIYISLTSRIEGHRTHLPAAPTPLT
jgi:RsiW-degrading membrane proteinase PrsW (M82 family)